MNRARPSLATAVDGLAATLRRVCRPLAWVLALLAPASALALPNFTATPTTLAFGNVAVGATATVAVVITNVTGGPLTPNFAGGAPADGTNFGGSQNCAGVTLAPGGTCRFDYTFSPATTGPKTTSTTIDVDAERFAISLSGTGILGLTVAPTALDFGSVAVGAKATIPVVITNVSGVALTPNYSGGAPSDGTHFGGSQNCAGVTLAPGGTCRFDYEFKPTSVGAKSTSTTIGVNDVAFTITMAGTAILGLTVAPTTLDFGTVAVGATASIPVVITNVSWVPLTPNYAGGAPADATNFDGAQNCAGITLPPAGTCRFTYEFKPATAGAKATTTTIDINNVSFAIAMSGVGVLSSGLVIAPLALDFGDVAVGSSATLDIVVSNPTAASVTAAFNSGTPLDATNFSVVQDCVGTTLAPGGTCRYSYTFRPATPGDKTSTASISIQAQPTVISLQGRAFVTLEDAAPIPTLGPWALALLVLLLGFATRALSLGRR